MVAILMALPRVLREVLFYLSVILCAILTGHHWRAPSGTTCGGRFGNGEEHPRMRCRVCRFVLTPCLCNESGY